MFNLDYFSLVNEDRPGKYIDRFTQLGYDIKKRDSFQKNKTSRVLDGVIIFEEDLNNIAEACKYMIDLKKESDALIWVIVSGTMHSAKLIYLQMGADAVFTYEADMDESILTISNALKRYKKFNEDRKSEQPAIDTESSLKLNSKNLSAVIDGCTEIPLTRIEYKIMELLTKNPNVAISYQDIYKEIWDDESKHSKFRVSNVIFHLRKKFDEDSIEPRFIKTIRSKGYLLNV